MFLVSAGAGPRSDPGDDFWYSTLGGTSLSGTHVSPATALRLSTVYKCVKVIAETVATLPRHVYRRGERRERLTDHPLVRLLSMRPNRWQTPMQFVGMLEAHRSLRGNAYAEIYYGARYTPEELVPIHPDRVCVEVAANGMPRYRVKARDGGSERVLVPGEIMHLTGLSMDGYTGLSPVEAEREAIGAAIAARDYGSRFWANDAKPPFWIKLPGEFKDDAARTSFRTQWQAAYGGANRHRPAVLDKNMELHELGVSNADAQWIEARKMSDVDICGLWRMPPHKVGILDRATWGNVEHLGIEFVTDTILPQLVGWEECIARDLIPDDDVYVEFLVEQLLRGDTQTRYNAYGAAIKDGWMTRNEARRRENMEPLAGLDQPLQPLNMAPAGAVPQRRQLQQPATRERLVLAAAAARVARKEAGLLRRAMAGGPEQVRAAFAGHAEFVAGVLALQPAEAAAYCEAAVQQACQWLDDGTLGAALDQQWIDAQTAALMRLED